MEKVDDLLPHRQRQNFLQCVGVGIQLRAVALRSCLHFLVPHTVCFEIHHDEFAVLHKGAVGHALQHHLLPCGCRVIDGSIHQHRKAVFTVDLLRGADTLTQGRGEEVGNKAKTHCLCLSVAEQLFLSQRLHGSGYRCIVGRGVEIDILHHRMDGSTLLCDIGTNGELVFAKDGKITCTSTAAGPALEGAEISCGMTAGRGAVDRVRITDGHLSVSAIEDAPAIGICGSGLISAAAALLDLGVLEPSGYLEAPFKISEGVTLLPADIRKLQAAKAAIHAGIEILTRESIPDRVVIAGGFGHYLDIGDCIRIGLLPEWVHGRTVSVGNAALTGACMMLQNSELIEEAESFAKAAELCELDLCGEFPDKYVESIIFSNKE